MADCLDKSKWYLLALLPIPLVLISLLQFAALTGISIGSPVAGLVIACVATAAVGCVLCIAIAGCFTLLGGNVSGGGTIIVYACSILAFVVTVPVAIHMLPGYFIGTAIRTIKLETWKLDGNDTSIPVYDFSNYKQVDYKLLDPLFLTQHMGQRFMIDTDLTWHWETIIPLVEANQNIYTTASTNATLIPVRYYLKLTDYFARRNFAEFVKTVKYVTIDNPCYPTPLGQSQVSMYNSSIAFAPTFNSICLAPRKTPEEEQYAKFRTFLIVGCVLYGVAICTLMACVMFGVGAIIVMCVKRIVKGDEAT